MTLPGEWVDPSPPASLAAGLTRSVLSPRFLLEVTSGITARAWKAVPAVGASVWAYALGDGTGVFNDSVDEINQLTYNGTALLQVTTTGALVAGSWMWDSANLRVLLWAADSLTPMRRTVTIELYAIYRFSDAPSDAGGFRWKPWLLDLPALTRRVSPGFNGISQVGSGAIKLQNETHFFDTRLKQNWDAGRCTLKMGTSALAYAKFQTLATFVPSTVLMTDSNFTINTKEAKVLLDTLFPSTLYDLVTYPNLDPQAVGNPVQVAYGNILGAVPVCIDTLAGTFKVAGHAIKNFNGIRKLNTTTNTWDTINFLTTSVGSAQFTLSSLDWKAGDSIVVDFSGKKRANGTLMDNPSEIVSDILTSLGQTVDAAGFETARLWYDIGYRGGNVLDRVSVHAPAVYLDAQAKALTTIEQIMVNARAYLQTTPAGAFTMAPFRNYQASTLPVITDNNCLEPGIKIDSSGTSSSLVQAGQKVTQATVVYGIRSAEGIRQAYTYSSAANKYTRGLPAESAISFDSLLTDAGDAQYLAQALVNEYRVDPLTYSGSLKWLAFNWLPAGHVRVVSARHGIDVVCEILSLAINLTARNVAFTLGNLRGFEESSGFWVNTADVTPLGASLAWPANGQTSDPGETQYRRHQAGHWHAADDFAVNTATATKTSNLDYSVSRWQ